MLEMEFIIKNTFKYFSNFTKIKNNDKKDIYLLLKFFLIIIFKIKV